MLRGLKTISMILTLVGMSQASAQPAPAPAPAPAGNAVTAPVPATKPTAPAAPPTFSPAAAPLWLRPFVRTHLTDQRITAIDAAIARHFTSVMARKPIYKVDQMTTLLKERADQCDIDRNVCLDGSAWTKLTCKNENLDMWSTFEPAWRALIQQADTEAEIEDMWQQVLTCSEKPMVFQMQLAGIILSRTTARLWDKKTAEVVKWLKTHLKIIAAANDGGALAGKIQDRAMEVYSNLVFDMGKWVPTPTSVAKDLADEGARWFEAVSTSTGEPDNREDFPANMIHAWTLAGARSQVLPFTDKLNKLTTPIQRYSKPWLAVDYCRSARDLGKYNECDNYLVIASKQRADLFLDLEIGINLLKRGNTVEAIASLTKNLAVAKVKNKEAVKWFHLYLGYAEYARGGYPAAQAQVSLFQKEVAADRRPFWVAAGRALQAKIYGATGKYPQAIAETAEIRKIYRANVTGPFMESLTAEFDAVINSLRAGNKAELAKDMVRFSSAMVPDPSQAFYEHVSNIVALKLKGQPIEVDVIKLQKLRGAENPDFKEFVSVLKKI